MCKKINTFVLFKPWALRDFGKETMLKKLSEFEAICKFKIAEVKNVNLKKEEWEVFYGEHKGKPFYEDLVNFMAQGPVVAVRIRYRKSDKTFIQRFRTIVIGNKDPRIAKAGTMRSLFGNKEAYANGIPANGSHSPANRKEAKEQIKYFFKKKA